MRVTVTNGSKWRVSDRYDHTVRHLNRTWDGFGYWVLRANNKRPSGYQVEFKGPHRRRGFTTLRTLPVLKDPHNGLYR